RMSLAVRPPRQAVQHELAFAGFQRIEIVGRSLEGPEVAQDIRFRDSGSFGEYVNVVHLASFPGSTPRTRHDAPGPRCAQHRWSPRTQALKPSDFRDPSLDSDPCWTSGGVSWPGIERG